MKNHLIDAVEKKYRRENELEFGVGETVRVTIKIVEGNKERLQDYEGVVIARKGTGLDEMFTVRRLVGNEGVERTFPLHSPKVVRVKTVRRGKIRRCKLYYLRARVGRARKLRERRISAEARKAALEAQMAKSRAVREADQVADAVRQREAGAKSGSPELATSGT
jgi:large subunit ribosomal protein L19